MEKTDRNCLNCAHCDKFKYSPNDKKEMMRCWNEPDVIDHPLVQTVNKGKKYICCEHQTVKEFADEQLLEAVSRLKSAKSQVRDVFERFDCLKQTPESILQEHTWHKQEKEDICDSFDDWSSHKFACITKGGKLVTFFGFLDETYDGHINKHIDSVSDDEIFVDDIEYWIEFPN